MPHLPSYIHPVELTPGFSAYADEPIADPERAGDAFEVGETTLAEDITIPITVPRPVATTRTRTPERVAAPELEIASARAPAEVAPPLFQAQVQAEASPERRHVVMMMVATPLLAGAAAATIARTQTTKGAYIAGAAAIAAGAVLVTAWLVRE